MDDLEAKAWVRFAAGAVAGFAGANDADLSEASAERAAELAAHVADVLLDALRERLSEGGEDA